jgi:RNA polymerase sigma-70 factor (ECF subfamily)
MADLDEIHRRHWARVVAIVARAYGDLDLAEDAAAEAFAAAVERWAVEGVPDSPGAWLITVARNKALDRLRRESSRDAKQSAAHEMLVIRAETSSPTGGSMADDRLRLLFTCCHPALSLEARTALTLRMIAGLTTPEVARAFWVPEATMGQRLVRAKRKIRAARIPYRVPEPHELPDRLAGVLRVIYLVFREGYTPSGGADLVRTDLCNEAIRLARLVLELLPNESEVTGLLGLLLVHHGRRAARTDATGNIVLLHQQDRRRWDNAAIREGASLAAAALLRSRGPYALQAAIAVCHAAPTAAETDWPAIAALYGELTRIDPSPAVVLNRAVAVAEVDGPAAGLAIVDSLLSTAAGAALAASSHQPHVARADFLRRLGRTRDAAAAYRRAAEMAPTAPERRFLAARLADLSSDPENDQRT